jgi:hypothetical protein
MNTNDNVLPQLPHSGSGAFILTTVTVWINTAVYVVNGNAECFFGEGD